MQYIIIVTLFCMSFLHASSEYKLGEGYGILDEYLYLGAYFSSNYISSPYIDGVSLDDFGLLAYGSTNRLSYMLEYESFNPFQYDFRSKTNKKHTSIYAKRAFFKYQMSDSTSVKIGKFYTPIGFWREIPINVLRETTSIPLTAQKIYPEYSTGINFRYEDIHNSVFTIDIVSQLSKDIDPAYNNSKVKEHSALSFSYKKSNFSYQASFGYYKEFEKRVSINVGNQEGLDYIQDFDSQYSDDTYTYMLIGLRYENEIVTLQSELSQKYKNSELDIVYMAYIQSIYKYTAQSSFIVRYEDYKEDDNERSHDNFSIIGYTYRPYSSVAFKSEYQFHHILLNDKAIFSFSMLF